MQGYLKFTNNTALHIILKQQEVKKNSLFNKHLCMRTH